MNAVIRSLVATGTLLVFLCFKLLSLLRLDHLVLLRIAGGGHVAADRPAQQLKSR